MKLSRFHYGFALSPHFHGGQVYAVQNTPSAPPDAKQLRPASSRVATAPSEAPVPSLRSRTRAVSTEPFDKAAQEARRRERVCSLLAQAGTQVGGEAMAARGLRKCLDGMRSSGKTGDAAFEALLDIVADVHCDAWRLQQQKPEPQQRSDQYEVLRDTFEAHVRIVVKAGLGAPKTTVSLDEVLLALAKFEARVPSSKALQDEDLALALEAVCTALGGQEVDDKTFEALQAHALSKDRGVTDHGRALMIYHLALSRRLSDNPLPWGPRMLQKVEQSTALNGEARSLCTWAVGLHLCGDDPFMEDWHSKGQHLVSDSEAPRDQVLAAIHAAQQPQRVDSVALSDPSD